MRLPITNVRSVVTLTCWIALAPALGAGLDGRVVSRAGAPLSGATVFVYEAAPRVGPGVVCPSCYPDCRKSAVTGADGSFSMTRLNDDLKFRLLIVADGYQPAFAWSDPRNGEAKLELDPRDPQWAKPESTIRGVVVGPDGTGVAAATVTPVGYAEGSGDKRSATFGALSMTDPLVVTDAKGRFSCAGVRGREYFVLVEGRSFAPRCVAGLQAGAAPVTIKLGHGTIVTGRLLDKGKPVAGATVGVVMQDRRAERDIGVLEVGTAEDGRFAIAAVPPADEYFLYAKMTGLSERGALRTREITALADDKETSLGDLALEPAVRIAGRVVGPNGEALPGSARVALFRENVADWVELQTGKDGSFAIPGVPHERVMLQVVLPGYRISRTTKYFDTKNASERGALRLRATANVTDLQIMLEKVAGTDAENVSDAGAPQVP